MINRILYRIISVCIILCGILFYAGPTLAGIGVQPTITELELTQGQVKTGSFRVANGGEELVVVKVEVEDWLKLRGGESPVDVKDWLIIDETEFELEPAEIKDISYKIFTPQGIKGELVAMVFFSSAVPGGGNLSITSRFGVSVYVGIEGTEIVDAGIDDIEVNDSGIAIVVRNKGNVHLRPSGKVVIRDSEDSLIDEVKIPYIAVIFAGKSHKYPLDLSKLELSPGEYSVEAIFDTGTIYNKAKTFKKTVSMYLE